MLVILPIPHPKVPASLFNPKMLWIREHAPTPYSSVVFTSNSHLSLLRSLGACQKHFPIAKKKCNYFCHFQLCLEFNNSWKCSCKRGGFLIMAIRHFYSQIFKRKWYGLWKLWAFENSVLDMVFWSYFLCLSFFEFWVLGSYRS
jgi:hypothetical protein